MQPRAHTSRRGFTLIIMMVVLTVIAIVALYAIPLHRLAAHRNAQNSPPGQGVRIQVNADANMIPVAPPRIVSMGTWLPARIKRVLPAEPAGMAATGESYQSLPEEPRDCEPRNANVHLPDTDDGCVPGAEFCAPRNSPGAANGCESGTERRRWERPHREWRH
ncbi:MAG: prepilin-type N-terminal cleavage/methylation domain-containing protein [Zoogloeaceae bacterium]|nr:prepilin-type N-terminal cleavage/methylation domain-containing protein [Zoogloeaceae bacterium]